MRVKSTGVPFIWGFACRLMAAAIVVACGGARPRAAELAPISSAALVAPAPGKPLAPPPAPSEETAAVPVSARDPQWGKPDAPVTIVAFGDFQGPFGARAEPTVQRVCDTYGPSKVRLVWKNNPLPFHRDARAAAEAAMAVFGLKGGQAFWAFLHRAFSNQRALTDDSFAEWASESEIDLSLFKGVLAAKKYSPKIDEDVALATKLGIRSDPSFRINGVAVDGAQPFEKFQEVVDAQLAQVQAAVASGTPKSELYATLTNKNHAAALAEPQAVSQEASDVDRSLWKVPVSADDPVRGDKGAPVTVVEFADLQDPFSKSVEDTLQQLLAAYGSDIRIVWKDHPLPYHARARHAATLARAAYQRQGDKGFWDAHDRLFASSPNLEDDDLKRITQSVGINWAVVKQAIDSKRFASKFDVSSALAQDLNAGATPTFFINGVRLVGAAPFERFKAIIDGRLAAALEIVAGGVPRASVYDAIMKSGREHAAAAAPTDAGIDSIEASHVLVQYQGAERAAVGITRTKEEALKRAEQALAKLKQGADFARIAVEYSDDPSAVNRGGAIGSFRRGQMDKLFEDPAFALKINELSGIVETPFGFHVIKRTK